MEKKSKKTIIIGITCLLLVTLILLGLTYAYYRTRIVGNDADTSISVQSKKMEVTYEDGTAVLSTEGKIEPGFTASKTFYVENTGDQSANYSIVLEDMNNEFSRNEDWQYTLTENGTQISSGTIAVGRHQVLVGSTNIAETTGTKNTYVLTITYANSDEDQSADMGMNLSFKVNISDESYTWEDAPSGSLLYALKNNQPTGTETTVPGQASTENEARILITEDDYGTSYVYRGAVTNNYVNYSGMCWRVLRVQGDGTIKLVLADENNECDDSETNDKNANGTYYSIENTTTAFINGGTRYSWGFGFYSGYDSGFEDSDMPNILLNWMNKSVTRNGENVANLDTTRLAKTDYCWDVSVRSKQETAVENVFIYNFGTLTLKCNMTGLEESKAKRYESNIAFLTAAEIEFAGRGDFNYLSINASGSEYWSMSPVQYWDSWSISLVWSDGGTSEESSGLGFNIRPVVVLKSDVLLDTEITVQNGTQTNPYVIS